MSAQLLPLTYPIETLPPAGGAIPVTTGIRWFRLSLPFALDHINLWLLEDGEALTIVDTGIGNDESQASWKTFLATDKRPLSRIIVTHCHPDHIGLASWLSAEHACPVYMTMNEFLGGQALWHGLPGYAVADMLAFFRQHGLDQPRLDALEARGNRYRQGVPSLPARFQRLIDGDQIKIGQNVWEVITGYGHSPEHASLYCAALGILISGDMLLPRISTNISVPAATPDDNPLERFLRSLRRIRSLPEETLVLPSHGKPFHGIQGRVDALVAHHQERCTMLIEACEQPRSACDVLSILFPRELDTHQVMFAMGEAIAHMNYLAAQNRLRRIDSDGFIRYVKNI